MSRRGGGRRSESQREQQSPPITMAASDRGERGRSRGRGRGGVQRGGYAASSSTPTIPEVGSTSSLEASLTRDVEQQLSLQSSMPEETRVVTLPPSSSKSLRFPARPGFGTAGSKCNVRANHFIVEILDKDLHHYDVTITPEVISRGVNRAVMNQLVGKHRVTELGGRRPAYDGRKSIYTAGALPFDSKEFVIPLIDRDGKPGPARKEREFKVAIKFASKVDVSHLQQFLFGRQLDAPQETIQALDIALRELPSRNYTVVGRSFFSLSLGQKSDGGDGLECWKGFYQSLRPTQMGLSLNVDVGATSFYEAIPIIEFVSKVLGKDPSRQLSDVDRTKVRKVLKGVKVHLLHRQDGKCLKVSGITTQSTVNLTFPVDDTGIKMSVVQYFKEKYQIKLQHVNWPALQAGSDTKPIYLPMEVCKIVEGQRYAKKLNEKQVTALLRASCKRPQERERSTVQIVKQNNYSKEDIVKEFGMAVKDELAFIGARVLPPPELKYHDTGRVARIHPSVGQWNMINTKMINGGTVDSWTCINFSRLRPDMCLQFCQDLVGMCTSKGMVFNPNPVLPLDSPQHNQIEKALLDLHAKCTAKFASTGMKGKQLQLLIVILPDFSGSYGRIKRVCETELGLVSQCCQPRQAAKRNKQYLENVSLKINVKVGGRNTALVDAIQRRIPLLTDLPTIIFGADVTHPQPGEDSSPSIAAVVGSMDWPEVTKYRALVSSQLHRQEMIQDLYKQSTDAQRGVVHGGMIRELLIAFRKSTGHKPQRIIFYRDGVSEGQFNQVLLFEMDAIRRACSSLEEGYLPPVTFVVVQKRHHTRLFPVNHNDKNLTDKSGNILPGTVVDTKICHPTEFDFYLCSHAGIQGTSRPTHYHVLWDENKFSADALQSLTNNLCYTYARCTRSVSIVPPAYYAHLAAFRARYYIEDSVSDSGSVAGGGRSTRDKSTTIRPLPLIRDNVKDVMFYC